MNSVLEEMAQALGEGTYNHSYKKRPNQLLKEVYIPLTAVKEDLGALWVGSVRKVHKANKYLAYQYSRMEKAKNSNPQLYWRIAQALLKRSISLRVALLVRANSDYMLDFKPESLVKFMTD